MIDGKFTRSSSSSDPPSSALARLLRLRFFAFLPLLPLPSVVAPSSAEAAEEVNLFTNDGKVIHFQNPTVQTSDDGSYVVTGPSETKAVADMMPAIASQLGSDAEAATLGPAAKPPPIKTSPETRTKKSGSGDGAEGGGSAGERGFASPQFMFRVVAVAAAAVAAASVFSALRRRDAARSYMHT